jgi:hypothetical protein
MLRWLQIRILSTGRISNGSGSRVQGQGRVQGLRVLGVLLLEGGALGAMQERVGASQCKVLTMQISSSSSSRMQQLVVPR